MHRVLAVFSLTVLALSFSASGSAQERKKEIRAVVQEIDVKAGTLTVILNEGGKNRIDRVRTFNLLKPDIPVTEPTGKARKITDLQEDDRVLLELKDEDVIAIRLAPPLLYGTLAKVDSQERTLLVRTKIGDKAVTVPASAKIYSANQSAQLQDLKEGAIVLVAFAQDQKTVLEVRSGKKLLPVIKLSKGIGYLIDIDRKRPSVQILANAQGGDYSLLREMLLSKDASFGLLYKAKHFRDISIADLSRGVKVQFWIDVTTRKIAHLEVEMPILGRRLVKTFDGESRQLTLEDSEGDKVLKVSPQVKVLTANGPGKLAEIQPAMAVTCALSLDRKTIELIYVMGK